MKLFQLTDQNLSFLQWRKHSFRPPFYLHICEVSVHQSSGCAMEPRFGEWKITLVSFGFVLKAMQAKTSVEVKGEISPSTCVYTSCYWYARSLIPCWYTCFHFVLTQVVLEAKQSNFIYKLTSNVLPFGLFNCHSNCTIQKNVDNLNRSCGLYALLSRVYHG